ncbi:MAG: thiamine-phosphate kinase [Betaproteobacteria bacterium]
MQRPPLETGVQLGIGDDCALLRPSGGMHLAVSTDMLVEGRHFSPGADAFGLGHKALAVNLSDLAAMGAAPRWATLALALPEADEAWLAQFSAGFLALAERFEVALVGGDTTRGPRNISVTIMGEVPAGLALYREGAQPGDEIWVSGELGGAALALRCEAGRARFPEGEREALLLRLHRPEPRVVLGERLRGIATAAIDVSDGFAGDLAHILERSGTGALVHYAALPRPQSFARVADAALERECVLSGGDDYELIFTAPQSQRGEIEALATELGLALSCVGYVQAGEAKLVLLDADGGAMAVPGGFDHFAPGAAGEP